MFLLKKTSEHPLAEAIVKYGQENQVEVKKVNDFQAIPGHGIEANLNGKKIFAGTRRDQCFPKMNKCHPSKHPDLKGDQRQCISFDGIHQVFTWIFMFFESHSVILKSDAEQISQNKFNNIISK